MNDISSRLGFGLKCSGLTQKELATRIHVTPGAISGFITGKFMPGDRTIADICNVLNIREEWLRTGEEPMMRETPQTLIDDLARTYGLGPDAVRILYIIVQAFQRLTPEQAHEMVEIARRNLLDMGEAARDAAAVRDAIEKSPDESGPEITAESRA